MANDPWPTQGRATSKGAATPTISAAEPATGLNLEDTNISDMLTKPVTTTVHKVLQAQKEDKEFLRDTINYHFEREFGHKMSEKLTVP